MIWFNLSQTTLATTDTSCESVVTSGQHQLTTPQHPPRDASPAGLVLIPIESLFVFVVGSFSFIRFSDIINYLLFVVERWSYLIMLCIFSSFYYGRLLSIAEETLTEFLSKATGTAVEWVQMPGMKVTFTAFIILIFNKANDKVYILNTLLYF